VTGKVRTAKELAVLLGTTLSELSEDYEFEFPLKNIQVGAILYKYRYQSYEYNMAEPGLSQFMFLSPAGLICRTYQNILQDKPSLFQPTTKSTGAPVNHYWDVEYDVPLSEYNRAQAPMYEKYAAWVTSLVGWKVDITGLYGELGKPYTPAVGSKLVDNWQNVVLVRMEYDVKREPLSRWVSTLGQLRLGLNAREPSNYTDLLAKSVDDSYTPSMVTISQGLAPMAQTVAEPPSGLFDSELVRVGVA
jgi:hypothetical protein